MAVAGHFFSKPVRRLKGFGTGQIRKFDFCNNKFIPHAGKYVNFCSEPVCKGDHVASLLQNSSVRLLKQMAVGSCREGKVVLFTGH